MRILSRFNLILTLSESDENILCNGDDYHQKTITFDSLSFNIVYSTTLSFINSISISRILYMCICSARAHTQYFTYTCIQSPITHSQTYRPSTPAGARRTKQTQALWTADGATERQEDITALWCNQEWPNVTFPCNDLICPRTPVHLRQPSHNIHQCWELFRGRLIFAALWTLYNVLRWKPVFTVRWFIILYKYVHLIELYSLYHLINLSGRK